MHCLNFCRLVNQESPAFQGTRQPNFFSCVSRKAWIDRSLEIKSNMDKVTLSFILTYSTIAKKVRMMMGKKKRVLDKKRKNNSQSVASN